jgi:hypothetical protein
MNQGLVLSAGMPRAGSGWHYNLIHDLILAGGGQDARQIRRQYHLRRFLTEVNCNIGTLSAHRLLPVLVQPYSGILCYQDPCRAELHRPVAHPQKADHAYLYLPRPAAALLSAYEWDKERAKKGRTNAFSSLTSLERAVDFMEQYVRIWERWMGVAGVLVVRYEDLVEQYDREGQRLASTWAFQRWKKR